MVGGPNGSVLPGAERVKVADPAEPRSFHFNRQHLIEVVNLLLEISEGVSSQTIRNLADSSEVPQALSECAGTRGTPVSLHIAAMECLFLILNETIS